MSDNMTPSEEGNALSIHDGADALAALKQPQATEEESTEETPDAEEVEVQEEGGEPEAQEAEAESEEAEPEESESQITLPDGTQITAQEAVKGYLREGDYTRKTQALRQKESQFEAQASEYVKRLNGVFQEVVSLLPQEPDWSSRVDEVGADQAFKEQQQWNARIKVLQNARAEIEQNEKATAARAQMKARETLLTGEFDKSWSDPKVLSKAMENVSEYLSGYGYEAGVLQSIADPNVAIIAEKARRYDELQKAKPEAKKLLKAKPKPLKPGGKSMQTAKEKGEKQVLNRFHQTRTQEDGLAALSALRARASS